MASEQTQVRERPIIFSAEMVRAILGGKKTMTRRVVKPQPKNDRVGMVNAAYCGHPDKWFVQGAVSEYTLKGETPPVWTCPYGKPGERLWVREKFTIHDHDFTMRGISYDGDPNDARRCGWTAASNGIGRFRAWGFWKASASGSRPKRRYPRG